MTAANEAITVPHAAAIAGMTIPHMQQLLRTGQVKGWRDGQQWKTTRQAVRTFLLCRADSRRAVVGPSASQTGG